MSLSTHAYLVDLVPGEKSVTVTLRVSIAGQAITTRNGFRLFKLTLANDSGDSVQTNIWGDAIEHVIRAQLKIGDVVKITNLNVGPKNVVINRLTNRPFNETTLDFELTATNATSYEKVEAEQSVTSVDNIDFSVLHDKEGPLSFECLIVKDFVVTSTLSKVGLVGFIADKTLHKVQLLVTAVPLEFLDVHAYVESSLIKVDKAFVQHPAGSLMTIAVADQSCVTFMPPPADLASLYNLDYSLYRKVVAQAIGNAPAALSKSSSKPVLDSSHQPALQEKRIDYCGHKECCGHAVETDPTQIGSSHDKSLSQLQNESPQGTFEPDPMRIGSLHEMSMNQRQSQLAQGTMAGNAPPTSALPTIDNITSYIFAAAQEEANRSAQEKVSQDGADKLPAQDAAAMNFGSLANLLTPQQTIAIKRAASRILNFVGIQQPTPKRMVMIKVEDSDQRQEVEITQATAGHEIEEEFETQVDMPSTSGLKEDGKAGIVAYEDMDDDERFSE